MGGVGGGGCAPLPYLIIHSDMTMKCLITLYGYRFNFWRNNEMKKNMNGNF